MAKNILARKRAARAKKLRSVPKDTPALYGGFPQPFPRLPLAELNPAGQTVHTHGWGGLVDPKPRTDGKNR
ncbi:MAG: hypothetical protein LBT40_12205 [Deltaproteobacteria bacterium]|nr:hypothetical protein [Deltaproteobacteria bacterium]